MTTPRRCKDCPPESTLEARWPGPRCFEHHRTRQKIVAAREHQTRVVRDFDLDPGDYDRLLIAQGGRCAICWKKPTRSRRLAVDHDHTTGDVRGLLCHWCNHRLLGRWSLAALRRAVTYLQHPPAREILGAITTERNPK
ncbi:endonuclease VII domain-containing protein [Gordonia sp. NPDC062954]|uniref:endonuclease VII domain-containing protein n=1 Tax=unclassified Gordonia (in: high G+C Gram-positive bacteria) TaxID=2657482 RepID=UPI000C4F7CA3|nr:endonuclease VII domain-containing protein [Gordonia sp. (in: high G+C Gram-positive bacteria)]MAU83409.1 recombination endonuclease VII [Gordonia sp. (in: high G+C Gram-positive bacteria)]